MYNSKQYEATSSKFDIAEQYLQQTNLHVTYAYLYCCVMCVSSNIP